MGPGVAWSDVPLGVACALAGLLALLQLATRRAPAADAAAHAAMGLGMAAMFVPAVDVVPRPLWIAVFVVSGAWFTAAALRSGSVGGAAGRHLAGAVAMLFMLLVGHAHHPAAASGGGGAALLVTVAALVLAAWFAADVLRLTLRPEGDGPAGPPDTVPAGTAPAVTGSAPSAVTGTAATATTTAAGTAAAPRVGPPLVAEVVMDVAMVVMLLGTT